MQTEVRHASCFLCEATCGLSVEVELPSGRIAKIRGDADDPLSRGYLCPKGVALKEVQEDPDRLRRPLRRTESGWQEVGWDEALDEIASRLHAIGERHGRNAVGFYVGNPTAHSYAAVLYGLVLLQTLGTRSYYTANSVDALPRLLASLQVYGSQALLPIPDLDRTSYLLVLGANPVVSNGSIMTAPDCKRRLREIRARGGKLVVVDPRRSETAELADEHLFVKPSGDAFLLLGMLQTIFAERLARPGRLEPFLEGLGELEACVRPYPPERVAAASGIEADAIRRLAREFSAAPAAICYGRMGTSVTELGTTTSWLIDALNAVTGNLDRPGGVMFTTPAVDLARLAALLGQTGSHRRWRSRVSGLPEFNGELPVAALAEEIETPGEGQIRALVTHAGNPVLSLPNGRRLERALGSLEFMVAIDIYLNETTCHADFVLPPTFGLEHEQYPLLFLALSVRNWAKFSPAILPAAEDSRHDWQVLLGLATRLLSRRGMSGKVAAAAMQRALGAGPRRWLDLLLRFGPHRLKLERLQGSPHGIDLGPLEPRVPALVKSIRLAPPLFLADLARVRSRLEDGAAADGELMLIGRRTLRSNNSWMHNSELLVRGKNRCTLLMHPDDARARGLASGESVRVTSRVGAIETELEVSDEVRPGVVSLPHGWGHGREGTRLPVANRRPGVSLNDVIDDARYDPISGTSQLSVPVSVCRP
jgi:anaerobic selenocysteine-containing dehydrogenase